MRKALIAAALGALALAGVATAQDESKFPPGLEPLSERIADAPDTGDTFPDVTIVDDEGRPVNIRSLAAEKPYTVLTLGCLT
ncbi:MAG: hypothetical protein AAGK22_11845 [Acidobacteriota bacterium]